MRNRSLNQSLKFFQTETPVDFQPNNLSEAVAAAMAGVEPPEISDTDETL